MTACGELPSEMESDNDTDDDSFLPDTGHASGSSGSGTAATPGTASPGSVRLILPKTRLGIQRRATVTGASPTSTRPPHNIEQVLSLFGFFISLPIFYVSKLLFIFIRYVPPSRPFVVVFAPASLNNLTSNFILRLIIFILNEM